jgi:uncharacterized phage-associated protein
MEPSKKQKPLRHATSFISFVFPQRDTDFDGLKIHKIAFYLYGHMLTCGIVLFDDSIFAYDHGHYIPTLELSSITVGYTVEAKKFYESLLSEEQKDLLKDLILLYSQYSGIELRQKCHCEPLWGKFWTSSDMNEIPQTDILKDFQRPYFEIERFSSFDSIKKIRQFKRLIQKCSILDIEALNLGYPKNTPTKKTLILV